MIRFAFVCLLFVTCAFNAYAQVDIPLYEHEENVVYQNIHGVGLVMDVFKPTGKSNNRGIIDVLSGAWYSGKGQIRDHHAAQIYTIFCAKGFTVFMVRPGSRSKFSVNEMVSNLQVSIRYIKQNAKQYGVDPERLGIMGASAGGHLALLTLARTIQAEDTKLVAGAVFFPPTDLTQFRESTNLDDLLFEDRGATRTDAERMEQLTAISPLKQIHNQFPPTLLIHGDADLTVPLFHSEKMVEALKSAGNSSELIVKPGGGHPWMTIHEEVKVMAHWFQKRLCD